VIPQPHVVPVQGFTQNPSDPTRFFQPQDNGNKVIGIQAL